MNKSFNEIIAIRFGEMIYFGEKALTELKNKMDYDQLISRQEFDMLGRMDFGNKFHEYAEHAPTLFKLDKDTPLDIRCPYLKTSTSICYLKTSNP